jgi:hypothetical protein
MASGSIRSSGEPRELFSTREHDEGDAHYAGLVWTPDGRYLLFGRAGELGGQRTRGGLARSGRRRPGRLVFAAGPAVYHEVWAMEKLPQLVAER